MSISDDTREVNPGKLIDLYIIDFLPIGVDTQIHFFGGIDDAYYEILFQGDTYIPWPMEVSGFERKGQGPETRPSMVLSNYLSLITEISTNTGDIVGAKITRKRTLEKYLGTMLTDDTKFSIEQFFVEQKVAETASVVEFSLASPLDFVDRKLPTRVAVGGSCNWSYKSAINGSGCGWTGTDMNKLYDRNGVQVFTVPEDVCGKRLSDCKLRFGAAQPLDFGGFPALGRV